VHPARGCVPAHRDHRLRQSARQARHAHRNRSNRTVASLAALVSAGQPPCQQRRSPRLPQPDGRSPRLVHSQSDLRTRTPRSHPPEGMPTGVTMRSNRVRLTTNGYCLRWLPRQMPPPVLTGCGASALLPEPAPSQPRLDPGRDSSALRPARWCRLGGAYSCSDRQVEPGAARSARVIAS